MKCSARAAVAARESSTDAATTTWPRSVNLSALPTRFVSDLLNPRRIADDAGRHVRGDVANELEALLVRPAGRAA